MIISDFFTSKSAHTIIVLFAFLLISQNAAAQSLGLSFGWNITQPFESSHSGNLGLGHYTQPRDYIGLHLNDWRPLANKDGLSLDIGLALRRQIGSIHWSERVQNTQANERNNYRYEDISLTNLRLEIVPIHFSLLDEQLKFHIGLQFLVPIKKKVELNFFLANYPNPDIPLATTERDKDIFNAFMVGPTVKVSYDVPIGEKFFFSPSIYTDMGFTPGITILDNKLYLWNRGLSFQLKRVLY